MSEVTEPVAVSATAEPLDPAALPAHLYVHVPLCRSKCAYCSFYSLPEGSIDPGGLVTDTLRVAEGWAGRGAGPVPLQTLYLGGGTPSMLGAQLPELLAGLGRLFPLAPGAEVTVEANPDSLDDALALRLAECGVTRVSLGVQSLSDGALVWLGRPHDAADAIDAMHSVVDADLDLSVDLMCGIPGVSAQAWIESLETVVAEGARHVSVYPLSVEPGTPLALAVDAGEERVPDEDSAAAEMIAATEALERLGLARYETANHAVPGHESRHNVAYWTGRPYLGIGSGAHGMLTVAQAVAAGLVEDAADGVARVRYAYADRLANQSISLETLDADEAAREDAMLGMRMTCGIDDALAARACARDALEGLASDGLVLHADGRWRATAGGWLLGNEIFGRIWNAG